VPAPEHFDIAVVGAGPGGDAAAREAARLGARVVVIERDQPGGSCLNWGCIPTKAFLASAELRHRAGAAGEMGLTVGDIGVDWTALLRRRQKIVERLIQAHHQRWRKLGITCRSAVARLASGGRITLTDSGGAAEEITADKIILATGSRPGALPGIEPDGRQILNSDHALLLPGIPRSLLIIGGGVIGCEFASLFADLGVAVTLVETMPSLLPLTDTDIEVVRELQRLFKKRRVKMHLGAGVEHVRSGDSGVIATLDNGETIGAARALLSVGRRPNTEDLGLETVGVTMGEKGGVEVDAHLATASPGLYALGDMTGQVQLAHLAAHQGLVAARHALGECEARIDLSAVPAVIFTRPCVATVGLSEAQAEGRGEELLVGRCPARSLGKAHAAGELDGLVKLIARGGDGRLIGAHMVGAAAEELIAEATLAVRHGLTLRQLADTIHAHPTMAESVWEAAAAALHQGCRREFTASGDEPVAPSAH
jgi:dihydrolipoamide dehydrogenase